MNECIKNLKKQFKLKKKEVLELQALADWLVDKERCYAAVINDYLKNNSSIFLKQIFNDTMDFLKDSNIPFYPVCIVVRAIIKNIARDSYILKE